MLTALIKFSDVISWTYEFPQIFSLRGQWYVVDFISTIFTDLINIGQDTKRLYHTSILKLVMAN